MKRFIFSFAAVLFAYTATHVQAAEPSTASGSELDRLIKKNLESMEGEHEAVSELEKSLDKKHFDVKSSNAKVM